MKELQNISSRYAEARRRGQSAALATVVRVSGSTYRRPGARMLITEDGQLTGCVSGGCLEREVLNRARQVVWSGEPRVVTYDSTSEDDVVWGFGLGCHGVVQVLIEPLGRGAPDPIAFIAECIRSRQDGVMATLFAADGDVKAKIAERLMMQPGGEILSDIADVRLRDAIVADARRMTGDRLAAMAYELPTGRAAVLIERIEPPLSLVIFGAGHDAVPLARLAQGLGWHVTLVDHRPADLARARGLGVDAVVAARPPEVAHAVPLTARTATVLMNHNYLDDLGALQMVLRSPVRYLGVLGPRRRTERLLDDLSARGVTPTAAQLERLYGPIGLDIGADNPDEIALAIAAEIQAVFADRCGGPSRDRTGPLHSRSDALAAAPPRFGIACEVGCAAAE